MFIIYNLVVCTTVLLFSTAVPFGIESVFGFIGQSLLRDWHLSDMVLRLGQLIEFPWLPRCGFLLQGELRAYMASNQKHLTILNYLFYSSGYSFCLFWRNLGCFALTSRSRRHGEHTVNRSDCLCTKFLLAHVTCWDVFLLTIGDICHYGEKFDHYRHSSKCFSVLCRRKSSRLGMAWDWVHFQVNVPFLRMKRAVSNGGHGDLISHPDISLQGPHYIFFSSLWPTITLKAMTRPQLSLRQRYRTVHLKSPDSQVS